MRKLWATLGVAIVAGLGLGGMAGREAGPASGTHAVDAVAAMPGRTTMIVKTGEVRGIASIISLVQADQYRRAEDHCGPEFLQNNLPRPVALVIQDAVADDFRSVCRNHDACYREQARSQIQCDNAMVTGMARVCDAKRFPLKQTCRFRARTLNALLRTSLGGTAYANMEIAGEITSHRARRINDRFSDDEVTDCVTVRNTTRRTLEYDVQMFTWDWRLVDTEPDTNERNIQSGQSSTFCVGTNFSPQFSRRDLGGNYKIVVRVDDPDSWAAWGDMLHVAQQQYPTP